MALCLQQENKHKHLRKFTSALSPGPDVSIDAKLALFTGSASSDALTRHFERRRAEAAAHGPAWIKQLADKLSRLSSSPELSGLGALAVAMLIDVMSSSPPEEGTLAALRAVFAEQKAAAVWDHVDECLKRYRVNLHRRAALTADVARIEWQLSAALTALKNALLRDAEMTADGLRAWVNGAAFHVQMLIQLARLEPAGDGDGDGDGGRTAVEAALAIYREEMRRLFAQHRVTVEKKCRTWNYRGITTGETDRQLQDEDATWHRLRDGVSFQEYRDAYYEQRYGRQLRGVEEHFSGLARDLSALLRHRTAFNVRV